MLKCFERVPAHLAPQLHAQLSAFDEPLGSTKPVAAAAAVAAAAEPPSGPAADAALQQTLAAALVAFEPAAGRLRLGEPAGAADEGSAHGGGAAATLPLPRLLCMCSHPLIYTSCCLGARVAHRQRPWSALAARRALCSTSAAARSLVLSARDPARYTSCRRRSHRCSDRGRQRRLARIGRRRQQCAPLGGARGPGIPRDVASRRRAPCRRCANAIACLRGTRLFASRGARSAS